MQIKNTGIVIVFHVYAGFLVGVFSVMLIFTRPCGGQGRIVFTVKCDETRTIRITWDDLSRKIIPCTIVLSSMLCKM